MKKGQIQTERGLVYVGEIFSSKEDAAKEGFSYAFHSSMQNRDFYSKCLDDEGHRHTFAVIE